MASTLAQIVSERKAFLRELGVRLKAVDSELEKAERKIRSLRSRKMKVPELSDFEKLADIVTNVSQRLADYLDQQEAVTRALQVT